MIDEWIEFNEYTINILNHPRFIYDKNGKAPNLLRAYDIIFRYAVSKSNKKAQIDKIKEGVDFLNSWIKGNESDFEKFSKNSFIKQEAFSSISKSGYYKYWFEKQLQDPVFKQKNHDKDLRLFLKNDQSFKSFLTEASLVNHLMMSYIQKADLRRNIVIFFPNDVLKLIIERCRKSYPIDKPARLEAGVIMLLGYYVASVKCSKSKFPGCPSFLREDFQNWIGDKDYIKNWWEGHTFKLRSEGILGTHIFNINKDKHVIESVDIDINPIECIDDSHLLDSEYIQDKGLYLKDNGSRKTYDTLVELLLKITL